MRRKKVNRFELMAESWVFMSRLDNSPFFHLLRVHLNSQTSCGYVSFSICPLLDLLEYWLCGWVVPKKAGPQHAAVFTSVVENRCLVHMSCSHLWFDQLKIRQAVDVPLTLNSQRDLCSPTLEGLVILYWISKVERKFHSQWLTIHMGFITKTVHIFAVYAYL